RLRPHAAALDAKELSMLRIELAALDTADFARLNPFLTAFATLFMALVTVLLMLFHALVAVDLILFQALVAIDFILDQAEDKAEAVEFTAVVIADLIPFQTLEASARIEFQIEDIVDLMPFHTATAAAWIPDQIETKKEAIEVPILTIIFNKPLKADIAKAFRFTPNAAKTLTNISHIPVNNATTVSTNPMRMLTNDSTKPLIPSKKPEKSSITKLNKALTNCK